MSRKVVFLAATAALLLAACGAAATPSPSATEQPSAAPGGTPRVVTLDIGDGKITPANVEVKKGETITFQAKNVRTDTEVEIIVGLASDVAADSGDSLKEAEHIAPGETKSVTYTFDGSGPYAYGDQIEDHYAKGAKGTITLVP